MFMSFEWHRSWEGEPEGISDPEAIKLDRDAQIIKAVARALKARKKWE